MITVVDYGLGNLGSILNMLRKLGIPGELTSDPAKVGEAARLILPGVGAFDNGMENLERFGLLPALNRAVFERNVPILGICLGAQLLTRSSEEGRRSGLGWLAADTIRFSSRTTGPQRPVPHMGWNRVVSAKASPLTSDLPAEPRFYFVHSYHFLCEEPTDILLMAEYGYPFAAAFSRRNVFGVQFHPEKSHKFGMKLLANFAALPSPEA